MFSFIQTVFPRLRSGAALTFGCVIIAVGRAVAAESPPAPGWTETFDDGSWVERWVPYGRLADLTWAQGVEGHWPKGEKTVFARSEWWRLENGAICGSNFPDEQHPAGLSRRDKLAPRFQETGIRLRCRVRLGDTSTAQIRIGGISPGIKPGEATDSHSAFVDVKASGIKFLNRNRVLISEEPAAEPGATRGECSRAMIPSPRQRASHEGGPPSSRCVSWSISQLRPEARMKPPTPCTRSRPDP
jgi:hypothetical protein